MLLIFNGKKKFSRNRAHGDPGVASTKEFKAPVMNLFQDLRENISIVKDRKSQEGNINYKRSQVEI